MGLWFYRCLPDFAFLVFARVFIGFYSNFMVL